MTIDESLKARMTAARLLRLGGGDRGGDAGGGGPGGSDMGRRLDALEAGLADVRLVLARMEVALSGVATTLDIARLDGAVNTLGVQVSALDARVGRIEATVGTALNTAVGKAFGPMQLPGVIAASAAALAAVAAGYSWISHQIWFPH